MIHEEALYQVYVALRLPSSPAVTGTSDWWRQLGHPVHQRTPLYLWARPSLRKKGVHDWKCLVYWSSDSFDPPVLLAAAEA